LGCGGGEEKRALKAESDTNKIAVPIHKCELYKERSSLIIGMIMLILKI
jgi:hypothetical protein